MRMLFVALAVMLASVALTLVLREENGYFLLGYGVWTLEGSLALFVITVVGLFLVAYGLLRGFAGLWSVPDNLRVWRRRRMARRSRLSLTRGLIELAEGNWAVAEKNLLRHAESSETPLLNYLAAARVAQYLGSDERRDHYLQLAHQTTPSADVAVELTQAELQLSHRQLEQALATLNHLRTVAPGHKQVLKLLAELFEELKDWRQLAELLPALRKQKVLDSSQLYRLEVKVQGHLLDEAGRRGEAGPLRHVWDNMTRTLQREPELVWQYVRLQAAGGLSDEMEPLLREAIQSEWDERLVALYGQLAGSEPMRMLVQAENWLQERPRDPVLLLALGRLALRGRLWGKARNYLEASIGVAPSPGAYRELGALLEHLGEADAARECYRKGLELATQGSSPTPLPAPERLGGKLAADAGQPAVQVLAESA